MSILLDKPVKRTSMTIWVPRESWMFLQARMQQERMGVELSVNARKRLNQSFTDFSHEGKKQLKDAWEEGRWTSWSCEDMKKILDAAELPWEPGETIEYFEI